MKKYNLHEIMKNAWALYRKWAAPYKFHNMPVPADLYSFSRALKQVWADAKKAAEKSAAGIVRMAYAQYKREYSDFQTVEGSYDKRTKTIEVMTKTLRTFAKSARRISVTAIRGLCPRCHTYCYGDCMAR